MGECVTRAVVQPCSAKDTDVHVLGDEHLADELPPPMPRALQPSYESTYQEVHKAQLERIRTLVQTPEAGAFTHKDLTWAIHIRAKGIGEGPRSHAEVQVAYIPWVRVQDFVRGEESRIDGPCKFICKGSPSNHQGKLTFPRWNSYSTIMRCVCNV